LTARSIGARWLPHTAARTLLLVEDIGVRDVFREVESTWEREACLRGFAVTT
jgi:hypothetical protein